MALKDYSDNEAVRPREQDLVSTKNILGYFFRRGLLYIAGVDGPF